VEPPSLVAVEFLSAAIIHIAGGELLHIICDLWLTYPPEKNMKARLDHHPTYWGTQKMFQTTNQLYLGLLFTCFILLLFLHSS